jgi:hypothetical protein
MNGGTIRLLPEIGKPPTQELVGKGIETNDSLWGRPAA